MKTCFRCKQSKQATEFCKRHDAPDGLMSWCRSCTNEKGREKYKDPKVKQQFRNRSLKYTFGITIEDYNKMFIEQNGCCKTCKRHQSTLTKNLVVDHNHATGDIRGLLCDYCNRLLGNFENKPELFKEFELYLTTSVYKKVSNG